MHHFRLIAPLCLLAGLEKWHSNYSTEVAVQSSYLMAKSAAFIKTIKMSTKYLFFVLALSAIGQATNAQTFEWAKRMGGTDNDAGLAIAVDASGNVYTAGLFYDTADFDPGPDTFNLSPVDIADIFITKFDASGNLVWAKQMGGTQADLAYALAVDASGNIYTTGVFYGTADFDPGPGTFNLSNTGVENAFISKLDTDGNFIWAKRIGGTLAADGYSIAVDASGNVYTTGFFVGTVDFDPGIGIFNLSSAGIEDIFISKLDSTGNFVWAKRMGGTDGDVGHSIAVDASGNVYTTGDFWGTVDFNPGSGTFNLSSAGNDDIFISKLNASGNFVWAKRMGGTGFDVGQSIAVDASGNAYTTGFFRGTVDFDPGAGTFNLSSAGSDDVFISKLDASGNLVWARRMGGTSFDAGNAIKVDASGNVYTTGYFRGTVDFDPGAGVVNLSSAGTDDVFVSKLDASGNFVWAKKMGGSSTDVGYSIAVDANGNVYTSGGFRGTADFDPEVGTFNLTSAGIEDIFVHKISQTVTGVSVNLFDKEIIVYPNPTSGPIHITLGENTSKTDVIVRNYLGQEVFKKSYTSTDIIELTLEGEAGFYLIEIREDDKRAVAKVIKY